MNWITIKNKEEVSNIVGAEGYAVIYKHSPRCMTSLMAYRQLKSEVSAATNVLLPIYLVDVIDNRAESMAIAESYQVQHQSPQILLVKDGKCIYNASHERVSLRDVLPHLEKVS